MLIYILDYLINLNTGFAVFEYITLRAILSIITALFISLILGPVIIKKFSINDLSEVIREDGPKTHHKKAGTPTMGGLLIISSLILSTIIWADLENKYILYLIFTTIIFAVIGFIDDYKKIKNSKGISARTKIFLQIIASGFIAIVMFNFIETQQEQQLLIPFFKNVFFDNIR